MWGHKRGKTRPGSSRNPEMKKHGPRNLHNDTGKHRKAPADLRIVPRNGSATEWLGTVSGRADAERVKSEAVREHPVEARHRVAFR